MYQFDYEKLSLAFFYGFFNIIDIIWESVIFVKKEKE